MERTIKGYFWLGVFSFVVLAIFAGFVVFFIDKSETIGKDFIINAYFDNVGGLKQGAPVMLQGLPVGMVSKIKVAEKNGKPCHVAILKISNDPEVLKWLRTDCQVRIVTDNLFGDKRIDINFGATGKPLSNGCEVMGQTSNDLNSVLGELSTVVPELRETMTGLKSSAGGLAMTLSNYETALNKISRSLDKMSGSTSAAVREINEQVKAMSDQMTKIQEIANTSTSENKLVAEEMKQSLKLLAESSQKLNDIVSRDTRQSIDDLRVAVKSFSESVVQVNQVFKEDAPRLGYELKDFAAKFTDLLTRLNAILDKLEKSKDK